MAVFDPLKLAKLVSRKIEVAEKLLNFHTMKNQSKFQAFKIVKMAVFDLLKSAKIDFR